MWEGRPPTGQRQRGNEAPDRETQVDDLQRHCQRVIPRPANADAETESSENDGDDGGDGEHWHYLLVVSSFLANSRSTSPKATLT